MAEATASTLPPEAAEDRGAFVARLAAEFSTVLREDLDEDAMREVVDRNSREEAFGPCHSHDFCDANMSMLEAIRRMAPGWDFRPANAPEAAIWNDAWEAAKESGFATEPAPSPSM